MRVYKNKAALEIKFAKKSTSEQVYYDTKKFCQEVASPLVTDIK